MRRAGFVLSSFLAVAPAALAQQPPVQPLQPVGGFGGQAPTQPQTQPQGQPTGGTRTPAQPGGALPVVAPAQPAAPAAPVAPDAATLKHLEGWEAAMKGVKTFYADATKTDTDVLKKQDTAFTAQVWLLKPNMARMDVTKAVPKGQQPTPADVKMYISNGRTLYLYDGSQRKRTQAALGPGGAGNNLLLDLMSGMSAKQVTERFTVKTVKVDEYGFVHLQVLPVFKADKEEFDELLLVLCGPQYQDRAYIPRRIRFTREGGQQTETWDFPDPKVNPKGDPKTNPDGITAATFTPIDLPKGWADEKLDLPRAAAPGTPAPTPGGSPRVPTPGGGR